MERASTLLLLLLFAAGIACAATQRLRQLRAGNKCKLLDGSDGVCRALNMCSSARKAQQRREAVAYCSRRRWAPIVCCDDGKASKMCKKFADAVYITRVSPVLLPGAQTERVDSCAMKGVPFVVGGEETVANEFPHMALLGYQSRKRPSWICGGSLISERYILTAAHCFKTVDGDPVVVRLGERSLKNKKELNKHEDIAVEEVIPHPQYKSQFYFDVGLIKLKRDVKFTASIRPACLNTEAAISSTKAVATGWGYTNWASNRRSDTMMKVVLSVQEGAVCSALYDEDLRDGYKDESMLCAGEQAGGKDTCQGDSGGPLQTRHKNHYCTYQIIGITSFGSVCGYTKAAVYSRVSYYVPWIESVVWPRDV